MYLILLQIHKIAVMLFVLIYLLKLGLLLFSTEKNFMLVSKKIKFFEIVVSFLFLITGVFMLLEAARISSYQIIKFISIIVAIPLAIVGFKRKKKLLATVSVLFIILSYGMADMHKISFINKTPITMGEKTSLLDYGASIYKKQCVACHGEKGELELSGAKKLKNSKSSTEEIETLLMKGKGSMPSYKKVLDEEAKKALITYLLHLRAEE